MDIETLMGKSGAYVVSERHRQVHSVPELPHFTNPAVAISHQTGAGALAIASGLAGALQEIEEPGGGTWEIFDQQIIERALQQEQWPRKLAESITEEKRFFLDEVMDDLFNLRPPSWVLMPRVIETALNLAMTGHAILVGHGATVVTADLPNVFHIRLTGSLDRRIDRVQRERSLTREQAAKFVKIDDHKREKYLKKYFHARLNNELLHDLAINTDRISEADAVSIIFEAARRFFSTL
ncbi:MAG TPA: cytidylate kinase-like family protein [Alphaproteobacteria bacterium]|nr:cytidylate kinase-like family protein [Alphaproteobacteria bacterium]